MLVLPRLRTSQSVQYSVQLPMMRRATCLHLRSSGENTHLREAGFMRPHGNLLRDKFCLRFPQTRLLLPVPAFRSANVGIRFQIVLNSLCSQLAW